MNSLVLKNNGFVGKAAIMTLIAVFMSFWLSGALFAADGDDMVMKVMCNIIEYVQGTVGKAVAILILISVAAMLFFGKLSWGLAIAIVMGMGLLFGSATIVETITADAGTKAEAGCKKS